MNPSDQHQAQLLASVIVPAYRAAATLPACLAALSNQTIPAEAYEIIVVDDASPDDTAELAAQAGARVVRLSHNQGRSQARNAGAEVARASILLFTDADCAPTPDWLAHMLAPFQADPDVVGVKGAYLSRQRAWVARFTQLEVEEKYDRMARQTQIDFIDTYSAGYRRDIFLDNGGFDPGLTYSMLEDQDLSFRLAAKGYKMVFAPQARVYHQHAASLRRYYDRKYTIGRWKAVILSRHPERLTSDSRTPLNQKVQFALMFCLVPLTPLALIWRPARQLWLAGLGFFALSGIPFLGKALQRDPGVAVAVWPLLLVRALALAHGYTAGVWGSAEYRQQQPILAGRQRWLKTIFDVALTGPAVGLSAPLLAIEALRLWWAGLPVWRSEQLIGQNGRPFTRYSLNTPRPWLRRLAQGVNVLRGAMSLVGPQAQPADVVATFSDAQRQRLAVRPGLIGPAHNGSGRLDSAEQAAIEMHYLSTYSLRQDLSILARHLRSQPTSQHAVGDFPPHAPQQESL